MIKTLKNKFRQILLMTAVFLASNIGFSVIGEGQVESTSIIMRTVVFALFYSLGIAYHSQVKNKMSTLYSVLLAIIIFFVINVIFTYVRTGYVDLMTALIIAVVSGLIIGLITIFDKKDEEAAVYENKEKE